MASRRKQFSRSKQEHLSLPSNERAEWACFIDDLVHGRIQATSIHIVRDGHGKLVRFDYDDPDGGSGPAGGGGGTRRDERIARGEQ